MDSEDRPTRKDTSSSAVTSSLSDLIVRLEKAQGPDRELDVRILAATQPGEWSTSDVEYACSDPERTVKCLAYTSSIDAAMTLVPEGMEKDFTDLYGVARASVGINANPGPFYGTHEGGSLAIALCIAALRARSHIESLPANDSAATRLEI